MHVTSMSLVDFNRLCVLLGKSPVSNHERINNQYITRQGVGDYYPGTGILIHKTTLPSEFKREERTSENS